MKTLLHSSYCMRTKGLLLALVLLAAIGRHTPLWAAERRDVASAIEKEGEHSILPSRPRYVLESHEDEVYHEQRLGERGLAPEYYAFLNRSVVFNRAMRWIDAAGRTLICVSEGGPLPLTGETGVSAWFSDPVNEVTAVRSKRLRFMKRSARNRDCVVCPNLQFNIEQHPRMRLDVYESTAVWQCCVLIKGRSGPPLIASEWRHGPGSVDFDLRQVLAEKGYGLHYPELSFVVGLWTPNAKSEAAIEFDMTLKSSAAVVGCLPVIRRRETVAKDGVPVSAVVVDAEGAWLTAAKVALEARCGNRTMALSETDEIWTGQFPTLESGEHLLKLTARAVDTRVIIAETEVSLRVTNGKFYSYDASKHSLVIDGIPVGPLSGSYQGMAYFRNVGLPDEAMVQGQEAFDSWDRSLAPGEHWHYWEALTEAELDKRFAYLARNGWRMLHLCQHWGLWEKLDAGGRIAPHGAEQAALYYRVAARHGLTTLQALSHYPYGSDSTLPYRQYNEAGFEDGDWKDVSQPFTERFHAYLTDYATLFREETALAAFSTSGEGDIAAGPDRVNDTGRFMAEAAPNHLFVSEPIHKMMKLPHEHYEGWKQSLYGARLYWIAGKFEPELDIAIEFKFMRLGPVFMGEGSWPCPNLYAKFMDMPRTWAGMEVYRTRVRDSLYLGLVHRVPLLLTWEEQLTEDEHRFVEVIRSQIDWSQRFQEAPVAIRVDSDNVRELRKMLRDYEEVFSAWPLATRYLLPNADAPEGVHVVFDARNEFVTPEFTNDGNAIPESVKALMPIDISEGYRASYSWSEDHRTLLAYVYNSGKHEECEHPLGGRFHRIPVSTPLRLGLKNLPDEALSLRIYDLSRKELIQETTVQEAWSLNVGVTASDFFVLVTAN
jgi:hypothetical protein